MPILSLYIIQLKLHSHGSNVSTERLETFNCFGRLFSVSAS